MSKKELSNLVMLFNNSNPTGQICSYTKMSNGKVKLKIKTGERSLTYDGSMVQVLAYLRGRLVVGS